MCLPYSEHFLNFGIGLRGNIFFQRKILISVYVVKNDIVDNNEIYAVDSALSKKIDFGLWTISYGLNSSVRIKEKFLKIIFGLKKILFAEGQFPIFDILLKIQ